MSPQPEHPNIERQRISHALAFPVGYELLRDHFASLIDWSETRFEFLAHPTIRASDFAHILREQKPYCILSVERRQATDTVPSEPAHWHFTVYPVSRELRSVARRALLSATFRKTRNFLKHAPTYWTYSNKIDSIFDPAEKTCRAEQLWEISPPSSNQALQPTAGRRDA